ncbi:MAG TPA: ATP-binding protein [Pseudonocardiaceae bacterium]|nr:ATP-binding protein [Pseudonocardiaceae bacterium]
MKTALRLHIYRGATAVVLRPVGELGPHSCTELRDGLLKWAAQEPPAIVVDLDSVRVSTRTSLMVFPAVWTCISDWPEVPMVLVANRQPLRTLVETSTVPWFVPCYRSVAQALAALEQTPPRRRRRVSLTCDLDCARRTRRLVEQTCHEWGVPEIAADATVVVSELTENVMKHAGSTGSLRLELRRGMFTIAVTDTEPRPPRLCQPQERRSGGRGLVLVAELSRAWGYAPQDQGGKVVWAVLTVPGPAR